MTRSVRQLGQAESARLGPTCAGVWELTTYTNDYLTNTARIILVCALTVVSSVTSAHTPYLPPLGVSPTVSHLLPNYPPPIS